MKRSSLQAEEAYRAALEELTRERVPLDWAMTQNNLGNALLTLGRRKSETEQLEQAEEAYRTALEEYTRERVPLNWAMTQNNLGFVLFTLGEFESDTERLEQAVEAYRAALEELLVSAYRLIGPRRRTILAMLFELWTSLGASRSSLKNRRSLLRIN